METIRLRTWKQSVFEKLLPRQVDATGGHCPSSPAQSRLNANTFIDQVFFQAILPPEET